MKILTGLVMWTCIGVLSGCASPSLQGEAAVVDNIDYARVQAMETAAQRFNTKIIWLRYPIKRDSNS